MKKVYVVAWESRDGNGVEWYHTPEAADKAFHEEKKNYEIFRSRNWAAYRFDFPTIMSCRRMISHDVECNYLNHLMLPTTIKYP